MIAENDIIKAQSMLFDVIFGEIARQLAAAFCLNAASAPSAMPITAAARSAYQTGGNACVCNVAPRGNAGIAVAAQRPSHA